MNKVQQMRRNVAQLQAEIATAEGFQAVFHGGAALPDTGTVIRYYWAGEPEYEYHWYPSTGAALAALEAVAARKGLATEREGMYLDLGGESHAVIQRLGPTVHPEAERLEALAASLKDWEVEHHGPWPARAPSLAAVINLLKSHADEWDQADHCLIQHTEDLIRHSRGLGPGTERAARRMWVLYHQGLLEHNDEDLAEIVRACQAWISASTEGLDALFGDDRRLGETTQSA